MFFKRFILGLLLYVSSVESEQIDRNFFRESDSLAQCTYYSPVLDKKEKIDIQSESISISKESIFLEDNVILKFEGGMFTSSSATLEENSNLINFNAVSEIFLEDLYLNAQKGSFDRSSNSFKLFSGISYWENPNIYISFDSAEGLGNEVIFEKASLTSCANSSLGWALKADEIIVNEEIGKGSAKKIKLEVFDKTIFRFPFLPIYLSEDLENNPKRHSRFLYPLVSYSSDGFDLTLPYKKILSPESDFTFGPRVIAKRGSGFEFNIDSKTDQSTFSGNLIYLSNDKEFDERYPNHINNGDQRWGYQIKSSTQFNIGILSINWADLSDFHFFRDVPGESINLNLQREEFLEQSISLKGNFENLSFNIGATSFKSSNPILTNGYQKKPYFSFSYNNNFGQIEFNSQLSLSEFSANKIHDFFGYEIQNGKYLRLIENPSEGTRTFFHNSLGLKKYLKNIELDASLDIKSLKYNLKDSDVVTNDVTVPSINVKISSQLFKQNKNKYSFLSPIYVFGYSQTKKQQLTNPIFDTSPIPEGVNTLINRRFSGYDRIEDDKFHAVGFEFLKEIDGNEKISFSIKKKFLFQDREIYIANPTLDSHSPISSSFTWLPSKTAKLHSYINYSEKDSQINNMGLSFLYNRQNIKLGLGQKFRRLDSSLQEDLYLTEFFVDIPFENGYSIFALGQRDNETDKFIEARLGLGYENCCFSASINASKRTLIRFNDINISNNMFLNDLWDHIIDTENKTRVNVSFNLKGFNNNSKRGIKRYIQNSFLNK